MPAVSGLVGVKGGRPISEGGQRRLALGALRSGIALGALRSGIALGALRSGSALGAGGARRARGALGGFK